MNSVATIFPLHALVKSKTAWLPLCPHPVAIRVPAPDRATEVTIRACGFAELNHALPLSAGHNSPVSRWRGSRDRTVAVLKLCRVSPDVPLTEVGGAKCGRSLRSFGLSRSIGARRPYRLVSIPVG